MVLHKEADFDILRERGLMMLTMNSTLSPLNFLLSPNVNNFNIIKTT